MAFASLSPPVAEIFTSQGLTVEALDGLVDDLDDAVALLEEMGLGGYQHSPYSAELLEFVESNRRQVQRMQRKRVNADVLTVTKFMLEEAKKRKMEGENFI